MNNGTLKSFPTAPSGGMAVSDAPQKRILVLGASALQVPGILTARRLNLYVIVLDIDADAPGARLADEFIAVSTNDEAAVTEVALTRRPDAVITLATDRPMRSVARATESLSLPGISVETASYATDKELMIERFVAFGVPHPWFRVVDHTTDLDGLVSKAPFPCISKPVDAAGSRGVVSISKPSQFHSAVRRSLEASTAGKALVQELLTGHEVSVEILFVDGEPHVLAVTDKQTSGAPNFVELGHSQPSVLLENDIAEISQTAVEAARALGVSVGPVHAELMLTAKGPVMIEIGARMGGDRITTDLVPYSTGIDMTEAVIRLALGDALDLPEPTRKPVAIRFIPPAPSGRIVAVADLGEIKTMAGILSVDLTAPIGTRFTGLTGSGDRIGHAIATGATVDEAQARASAGAEALLSKVLIDVS